MIVIIFHLHFHEIKKFIQTGTKKRSLTNKSESQISQTSDIPDNALFTKGLKSPDCFALLFK